MLQPMLTVDEAARFFRVRPKTIRAWIAAGRLAASKIGKSYRITVQDLNKAMSARHPDEDVKEYDPERRARIEGLIDMLRKSGITLEAAEEQNARAMELERKKWEDLGYGSGAGLDRGHRSGGER